MTKNTEYKTGDRVKVVGVNYPGYDEYTVTTTYGTVDWSVLDNVPNKDDIIKDNFVPVKLDGFEYTDVPSHLLYPNEFERVENG